MPIPDAPGKGWAWTVQWVGYWVGITILDMSIQPTHLQSWNRFVVRAFAVASPLLGATHTWHMDGAAIELRLPSAERIERDRNVDNPVR